MSKGILWAVPTNLPSIPRKHSEGQPHHLTLQFGVSLADWEKWIDRQFVGNAIALCHNKDIQAIAVKLPEEIQEVCQNRHPHITCSYREGISPVASNEMLATQHNRKLLNFPIQFRIEFLEWKK